MKLVYPETHRKRLSDQRINQASHTVNFALDLLNVMLIDTEPVNIHGVRDKLILISTKLVIIEQFLDKGSHVLTLLKS